MNLSCTKILAIGPCPAALPGIAAGGGVDWVRIKCSGITLMGKFKKWTTHLNLCIDTLKWQKVIYVFNHEKLLLMSQNVCISEIFNVWGF